MEKTRKKLYPELPLEDLIPDVAPLCGPSIPPETNNSPPNPSGHSSCPTTEPTGKISTCPVHKHYASFLEDYIEKTEEILDKFEEIKKRAADHHYKSNCAKVSSTVVTSTGVALVMGSLWWAPLTVGSSLVLGAGGAVMSVTGSLTHMLTDYIDYKTTASIMKDIKLLFKQKKMFDEWMTKSINHFDECLKQLMNDGINRETAISTIIEGIAKGVINIMEKPDNQVLSSLSKAVKLHRVEHLAAETLPIVGKTCHVTEKSFQFIYNILGISGRTVPKLIKDFARMSGILAVAFAMADVSLLIKDLCSEHPSVEIINKVVEKLKEERDMLQDMVDLLRSIEMDKESIIEKAMLDIQMIIDKDDLLKDFVIVNDAEFHEKAGITA